MYRSSYSTTYLIVQLLGVVLLTVFFWSVAVSLQANFNRLDIHFDLGFLTQESGFNISQKWIEHYRHSSNFNVLLTGLLNTIAVSVFGILLSMMLGVGIALLARHQNPLLRFTAASLISIFRNVPLLIQILFWYNIWILKLPEVKQSWSFIWIVINNRGIYFPALHIGFWQSLGAFGLLMLQWLILYRYRFMDVKGYRIARYCLWSRTVLVWAITLFVILGYAAVSDQLVLPVKGRFNVSGFHIYPEFLGLLIALSLYTSAFNAESIRGAIASVPVGQYEAGSVLNLTTSRTFFRVIVPQSLPGMLPPLSSHFLNLTKNSSLGLAIGYPEVFAIFAGTVLNQTGRSLEIIGLVMLIYWVLSMVVIFLVNGLNLRQTVWTGTKQH